MNTQKPLSQAEIDALTFDLYTDLRCSAVETAHQMGVSAQTVKNRVRRQSRRIRDSR